MLPPSTFRRYWAVARLASADLKSDAPPSYLRQVLSNANLVSMYTWADGGINPLHAGKVRMGERRLLASVGTIWSPGVSGPASRWNATAFRGHRRPSLVSVIIGLCWTCFNALLYSSNAGIWPLSSSVRAHHQEFSVLEAVTKSQIDPWKSLGFWVGENILSTIRK